MNLNKLYTALAVLLLAASTPSGRAAAQNRASLIEQGRLVELETVLKPEYDRAVAEGDAALQAECLLQYAGVYGSRANFSKALENYSRALDVCPEEARVDVCISAAKAALEGEEFALAAELSEAGLSLSPDDGKAAELRDCLGAARFLLGETKDYERAASSLPDGYEGICSSIRGGAEEVLARCPGRFLRFIAAKEIYRRTGRIREAAAMLDSIYSTKTLITSTVLERDLDYMDAKLDNESLRQENARLQAEKERSKSEYRKKILLISALCLAAVFVILALAMMVWYRLRSRRRQRETARRVDVLLNVTSRMKEPLGELSRSLEDALDGPLGEDDRDSVVDALIKSESISTLVGDLLDEKMSNPVKDRRK